MASPFASRDHYAVAAGRCFCGNDYTRDANGDRVHDDLATFHLDVHILGPQLANRIHSDRLAAIAAINAKAAETRDGA